LVSTSAALEDSFYSTKWPKNCTCNRQHEQQQELGIVSKFLHTAVAHIGAGAVVIF
jgi:hypothetical protein